MSLLPELPVPDGFAKPVGAEEPLFWIRELRFLRSWKDGVADEIRRIHFRKGLNVVWSPPPATDTGGQRIAGHASGKTTLCRLIRYMFDEPKMGDESFRNSVNHRFVDGFIVASVRLNGEFWCLARPFSPLRMPAGLSARTDSLDEFLHGDIECGTYADFRRELEKCAEEIVPVSTLPSGGQLTFRHFFPWFTRDQECHFSRIHDWRQNTTSETDAPLLNQTEKAIVMRSVYEPDIFKEVELSARQGELSARIKDDMRLQDIYAGMRTETLKRIQLLDEVDIPDAPGDLFVTTAQQRIAQEMDQARRIPPDVQSTLDALDQARREAEQKHQNLVAAYNATVDYLESLRNDIKSLWKDSAPPKEEELPPLSRVKLISQSMPDREYCCVPRSIAHMRGCHIGDEEEFSQDPYAAAEARKVIAASRQNDLEKKRNDYWKSYEIAQNEYRKAMLAQKEMEEATAKLKVAEQAAIRASQDRVSRWSVVLKALEDYEEIGRALTKLALGIEENQTKHKEVSAKLAAIRKTAKGRLGINECFAQVVKFVLGPEVWGKVVETGGDIAFEVTHHDAPYKSAALSEVETIAFDLAVLTMSIQGSASHPRFLVHDGPRVSDLTESIYRRYFDYAKYLEDRADGNPNFQYIITTTTPPPEEFQKAPYLCLKLDSSTPEGRLLKCDLN